jgi:hypothetical protein
LFFCPYTLNKFYKFWDNIFVTFEIIQNEQNIAVRNKGLETKFKTKHHYFSFFTLFLCFWNSKDICNSLFCTFNDIKNLQFDFKLKENLKMFNDKIPFHYRYVYPSASTTFTKITQFDKGMKKMLDVWWKRVQCFGDSYAFNDEWFYPNTYTLVHVHLWVRPLQFKRLPTIPWQTLALITFFSRMLKFPN